MLLLLQKQQLLQRHCTHDFRATKQQSAHQALVAHRRATVACSALPKRRRQPRRQPREEPQQELTEGQWLADASIISSLLVSAATPTQLGYLIAGCC